LRACISQNAYAFDGHQSAARDHLVEDRDQAIDMRVTVHDLDQDRQIA
jgi:hypothetical protein